MLILKDLERLQNGIAKMENFQAGGRWTQGGRIAEKLPGRTGSGGVNAGHGDREKRKRFEAAK